MPKGRRRICGAVILGPVRIRSDEAATDQKGIAVDGGGGKATVGTAGRVVLRRGFRGGFCFNLANRASLRCSMSDTAFVVEKEELLWPATEEVDPTEILRTSERPRLPPLPPPPV